MVLPGQGCFCIIGTAIKSAGTTQKLVIRCFPCLQQSCSHIGNTATARKQ